MFKIVFKNINFVNHIYDIATLEDIAIGFTNDEIDSKRLAAIAGHMKFGDTFSNDTVYMKCVNEEKR